MSEQNGTTIGKAYVQIMPSAEGIRGQLEDLLGGPLDNVGKSAGSRLGGAIKGGLVTAAKVGGAAVAAASAGVVALTAQAVRSYADYEQLAGGVETLFKESADQVQAYAADAYKTAGMSANQYMETVTGFSASLLQSLGGDTKAAAEMADLAITDMADNANKMGSDMASIENAYQGFAKQNYTMLDNLKLGYGGTAQEMYRLLVDAASLNEEFAHTSDFSIDAKGHLEASYADIVRAIHIVQDEMGITGTTAEEASKTISGSLGMLKSSWQNLFTGLADENADLDTLIGNVVESAETAANNLVPVMEKALTGFATLIEKIVPVITEKLPDLVSKSLPPLIGAATQIVVGLVKALPQIITVLVEQAPLILTELGKALMETGPILANTALDLITKLANYLVEHAGEAGEKFGQIVVKIVGFLIKAAPVLAEAALKIIGSLAMFLISGAAELLKTGAQLVAKVGEGIRNAARAAFTWGRDLIKNFIDGILSKLADLWDTIKGVATGIWEYIGHSHPKKGPLADDYKWMPDMMELYAKGIRENAGLPLGEVEALAEQAEAAFSVTPSPSGAYYEAVRTAVNRVQDAPTGVVGYSVPGGGSQALERILGLLGRYLPEAANSALLLDGDTLVARTAERTNSSLGDMEIRRGREGYGYAAG